MKSANPLSCVICVSQCDSNSVVCDSNSVMCDSNSVMCDSNSVMCDSNSVMCDSNSVMCDSVLMSFCRGGRSQRGCGEGQRQGSETAADRWDHSRLQTRLPRGGVLRQSHVPRPGRLPPQVWQFLLAVALKDTILQSVLHTMSVTSVCLCGSSAPPMSRCLASSAYI